MQCPLCYHSKNRTIDVLNRFKLDKLYFSLLDYKLSLNEDIVLCECENCKLRFYDPMRTGDEKFYSALQQHDWYYLSEKKEYDFSQKYIKHGDVVIDVGCGQGEFSKFVNEKGGQFIGLDFSENAKVLADRKSIKIENLSIQDYAKKFPQSADIVSSFQVLEHVEDPFNFLKSSVHTLKKDGFLIIAVPSEDSFLSQVTNGCLNMPPHHVTRWSDDTLKEVASLFNLELVELFHESVQPIHINFYWNTKIQSIFLQPKLIDDSLKRKVISKGAKFLSRLIAKTNYLPKVNGHTVIAVYKKK